MPDGVTLKLSAVLISRVRDKLNQAIHLKQKQSVENLFAQPFHRTNYICHWSKKHRYVYVETPKVACTTVKKVLQAAEINEAFSAEGTGRVHDRALSPLLRPSDDVAGFLAAVASKEFCQFCFVRNPYTRVLSCYLEKMTKNPLERKRLAPALGFTSEELPSFLSFLEAIREQSDEERDIHWAPQTHLLRPNRIRYAFIGRFESFRQHFRCVCAQLDINQFASELPDTDHATRASEQVNLYLGHKEAELIQEIYERDFSNFGYGWSPDTIC